jgi:hypothetical protein
MERTREKREYNKWQENQKEAKRDKGGVLAILRSGWVM